MGGIREVQGACVDVSFAVLGQLENNVYVVSDGDSTIVVDPSCDADAILSVVGEREVSAILITHFHSDHIGAAAELRARTGATVIASAIDAPSVEAPETVRFLAKPEGCPVDCLVEDGAVVQIGSMAWKVVATPGHTHGSVCYYMLAQFGNHSEGAPVLLSGDTLFAGTTGRTDFEEGSDVEMAASIKRLALLPDETLVLPGHGPLTRIGDERVRVFVRWGYEPEE